MADIVPLESLGPRIMILGPSSSGKSTLAAAIGHKLATPPTHLDRLRHLPNTNWKIRPDNEFAALHDQAVLASKWIIEGSYSALMPRRIERATGIIVLTGHLWCRYWRYFRRSLFEKKRVGALDGDQDSVTWLMIKWLWKTRNAVSKYTRVARDTGLPTVLINQQSELNQLYSTWGLQR